MNDTQRIDLLLAGLEDVGWPCRLEALPAYTKKLSADLLEAQSEIARLRMLLRIGGIEEE